MDICLILQRSAAQRGAARRGMVQRLARRSLVSMFKTKKKLRCKKWVKNVLAVYIER